MQRAASVAWAFCLRPPFFTMSLKPITIKIGGTSRGPAVRGGVIRTIGKTRISGQSAQASIAAGQLATGMLRILPRVWGNMAVEGQWKPGSMFGIVANIASGALMAAAKAGNRGDFLDVLARSVAKSIVGEFEIELRRVRLEAFQAGKLVGAAEERVRMNALLAKQAAEAATGKAGPMFPKVLHAARKADYAAAAEAATALAEYHGTTAANLQAEPQDIPPQPVHSVSGWVEAAGLHQGQLAIQFKGSKSTGSVVCVYPGPQFGKPALDSLLAAPSAGKWVWANVYHAAYVLDTAL